MERERIIKMLKKTLFEVEREMLNNLDYEDTLSEFQIGELYGIKLAIQRIKTIDNYLEV